MYGEDETAAYDLLYNRIKDYAGEAVTITSKIRARSPDAATLLDVGCGTGNHLVHLAADFEVEGVEASPAMAEAARAKLGAGAIHLADMRSFVLNRSFDAVVSLFSSIGYLLTTDALGDAIRTMAAHVVPGGVVIVEPWFDPDGWEVHEEGNVGINLVEPDGELLVRMVRSSRQGSTSHMEMHYLHGSSSGIRHFVEHHDLALFTRDEYTQAFEDAGLATEYERRGLTGRGLYIGVRRP